MPMSGAELLRTLEAAHRGLPWPATGALVGITGGAALARWRKHAQPSDRAKRASAQKALQDWPEADDRLLVALWPTASWDELKAAFPGRSGGQIHGRVYTLRQRGHVIPGRSVPTESLENAHEPKVQEPSPRSSIVKAAWPAPGERLFVDCPLAKRDHGSPGRLGDPDQRMSLVGCSAAMAALR